jgi:hypothetical protein
MIDVPRLARRKRNGKPELMRILTLALPVRAFDVVGGMTRGYRVVAADEAGLLFLGMLCEVEPELRHGKPVRLRFQRRRVMRQLEATLRPGPEFFCEFHFLPPL